MSQPTIALSAKRLDAFVPTALQADAAAQREASPVEATIFLSIPTPFERDLLSSRMTELGHKQIDQGLLRATLIDEIYKMKWGEAEVGSNENDTLADDIANRFDSFWQQSSVDQNAMSDWAEKETQRILDEAGGAPAIDPTPMPRKLVHIRLESRVRLQQDDIIAASPRLKKLFADQQSFGLRNDALIARIHIRDVQPVHKENWPELDLARDPNDMLSEEALVLIRETIGEAAWLEVIKRIDQQYNLPETEVKNSGSLLAKPSGPIGSTEPSDGSASSDGASTALSIEPAPPAGSEMTTARSSGSASETARSKETSGPTAEA